jgi:hypothetical protein
MAVPIIGTDCDRRLLHEQKAGTPKAGNLRGSTAVGGFNNSKGIL